MPPLLQEEMHLLGFGTFNPLLEKKHMQNIVCQEMKTKFFDYLDRWFRAIPNF